MDLKKKPCPICGYGMYNLRYRPFLGTVRVYCDICNYQGPEGKDFAEATKLWNYAVTVKEKTK